MPKKKILVELEIDSQFDNQELIVREAFMHHKCVDIISINKNYIPVTNAKIIKSHHDTILLDTTLSQTMFPYTGNATVRIDAGNNFAEFWIDKNLPNLYDIEVIVTNNAKKSN